MVIERLLKDYIFEIRSRCLRQKIELLSFAHQILLDENNVNYW